MFLLTVDMNKAQSAYIGRVRIYSQLHGYEDGSEGRVLKAVDEIKITHR
jgi:hypothetical protein